MRQLLHLTHRLVALALTLGLLLLNSRLYSPSAADYGPDRIGADVVPQLRFIGAALRDGADERMQSFFPEGFFFSHALYGLAWAEVGMRRPPADALRTQALAEARWALGRLDTPAGRAPFSPALDPPLGVFYVGWSSWLRGGVLALQAPSDRPAAEIDRFETDCAALAAAFDRSPTPFLTAYPGQAWPVDSTVAMAALRLHDTLLPARFAPAIARWLQATRERLDPATSLLPHRADPTTGQPIEGARGSSQSIIARFLTEIDPAWGREQYRLFRKYFVATPLGVAGVREYPQGVAGQGDVDSGPLVLGVSLSASAVTLGAALAQGDAALADPLLHAGETFGLPFSWGGSKRYLFGALPIGDAFLAWSKTARLWIAPPAALELPPVVDWWWRLPAHALSLVLAVLIWLPARRR
ncbi:MAG: hypothetical protein ACJ8CR_20450 [Roseiflexaceae bacterium]